MTGSLATPLIIFVPMVTQIVDGYSWPNIFLVFFYNTNELEFHALCNYWKKSHISYIMSVRKGPSANNVNQGIVDFLMGKSGRSFMGAVLYVITKSVILILFILIVICKVFNRPKFH